MNDLFYCIRVMQISTDKLHSNRHAESLRRTSLIRTTFVQSRKHFCDLLYTLIKISPSSSSPAIESTIVSNDVQQEIIIPSERMMSTCHKRKSCHVHAGKRVRLSSSPSVPNRVTLD